MSVLTRRDVSDHGEHHSVLTARDAHARRARNVHTPARDVHARIRAHDGTRIGKFKTFRTCKATICCDNNRVGCDDRANASDAQAENVIRPNSR
jgi:hypothetical protein